MRRLATFIFLSALVLSGCAAPPTPTPILPTAAAVPPNATRLPPTATAVPPTTIRAAPTATSVPPTPAIKGVTFTYLGQSMFTLKVDGGPTIMLDPVGA